MDLIKLLIGTSSLRIVDDATGVRKWPKLNVLTVAITATASTSDNPMAATPAQAIASYESDIINNMQSVKVIMPSAMTITALINDTSTAESIVSAWASQEDTFSITSRSIISNAMALVNVVFKQSNTNTSSVAAELYFEQTAESQLFKFDPKQPADSSQIGIATKAPQSLTSTVSTFYNSVTSKLGL